MDIDFNMIELGSNITYKNNKAYTEDGILVYKLYLTNVKAFMKNRDIIEYFCQYGPVTSVELVRVKGSRPVQQFGFITFEKAEDACKAVALGSHVILRKSITVKPADSWKQPFCEKIVQSKLETYTGPIDPEESPICRLNDDCIMHLYSFLPFSEQFKLSKMCKRFEDVFARIFHREYKHIAIQSKLDVTLMEWRQILKQFGHMVNSVELTFIYNKQNRFGEIVPIHCSNLKTLNFRSISAGAPLTKLFYKNIVKNLKMIDTIHLYDCRVNDKALNFLSKVVTVENLNIGGNFDLTGKHLDAFKNLKVLNIEGCANIQPSFFVQMCEKVSTLTSLNIQGCCRISNHAIKKMSEHCHNLKELTITSMCNIEPIANLPNLEKLNIHSYINVTISNKMFTDLVENLKNKLRVFKLESYSFLSDIQKQCICKLTALEELSLIRTTDIDDHFLRNMLALPNLKHFEAIWCTSLTQNGIIDFIRDAPKLEKLSVPLNLQLDSQFILSAIEVLKAKTLKLGKPFSLIVGSSLMDQLSIDSINSNNDIIEVSMSTDAFTLEDFLSNSSFDDDDDDDDIEFLNGHFDNLYDDYDHYDYGYGYGRDSDDEIDMYFDNHFFID